MESVGRFLQPLRVPPEAAITPQQPPHRMEVETGHDWSEIAAGITLNKHKIVERTGINPPQAQLLKYLMMYYDLSEYGNFQNCSQSRRQAEMTAAEELKGRCVELAGALVKSEPLEGCLIAPVDLSRLAYALVVATKGPPRPDLVQENPLLDGIRLMTQTPKPAGFFLGELYELREWVTERDENLQRQNIDDILTAFSMELNRKQAQVIDGL